VSNERETTNAEFQRDNPPLDPERDAVVCENCGQLLVVGSFPFCPHGRSSVASHSDDIPGGMWVENGFSEPIKVYSHSEHRRRLDENGNMLAPRWVENDRHLINWAAGMDAKTLENARELVSRKQKAYKDDVPAAPPALIQALKDQLYR
jgi:hypothetical protein